MPATVDVEQQAATNGCAGGSQQQQHRNLLRPFTEKSRQAGRSSRCRKDSSNSKGQQQDAV